MNLSFDAKEAQSTLSLWLLMSYDRLRSWRYFETKGLLLSVLHLECAFYALINTNLYPTFTEDRDERYKFTVALYVRYIFLVWL